MDYLDATILGVTPVLFDEVSMQCCTPDKQAIPQQRVPRLIYLELGEAAAILASIAFFAVKAILS